MTKCASINFVNSLKTDGVLLTRCRGMVMQQDFLILLFLTPIFSSSQFAQGHRVTIQFRLLIFLCDFNLRCCGGFGWSGFGGCLPVSRVRTVGAFGIAGNNGMN